VDTEVDLDLPVPLHPLVYLADGDEVTIGRTDIDSYGIFPSDGAEVVRKLADGATPREVMAWFEQEYDEILDIGEIVAGLRELDLVRASAASQQGAAPVRFARLGSALFSKPAWVVYIGLVVWAIVDMLREHDLVPTYHRIFFTSYYTIIEASLFVAAIPLLFLHEFFHALAGRRLGVRSSLTIGRRLYYLVLETSLDGLVAVPRRRRYLPIMAGMLADVVGIAVCVVAAGLTRDAHGALPLGGRFLLAVAFAATLRVVWQFFLYLRTDVYVLVSTMMGCVDLHTTARRLLANRWHRMTGRHDRVVDESTLHPADRKVARWYSWLLVGGYTASLAVFVLAGAPVLIQIIRGVAGRFTGSGGVSTADLLDSIVFTSVAVIQLGVLGVLALRDRASARRATPLQHVV
jgi:hypothetical protein